MQKSASEKNDYSCQHSAKIAVIILHRYGATRLYALFSQFKRW